MLTLPWIETVSDKLGLPETLVKMNSIWKELFHSAKDIYYSSNLDLVAQSEPDLFSEAEKNYWILKHLLAKLETKTDTHTAEIFKAWINNYHIDKQMKIISSEWFTIFQRTLWEENKKFNGHSLPENIIENLECLRDLSWYGPERERLKLLEIPITFLFECEDPGECEQRAHFTDQTSASFDHHFPYGDPGIVDDVIRQHYITLALQQLDSLPDKDATFDWFCKMASDDYISRSLSEQQYYKDFHYLIDHIKNTDNRSSYT